MGMCSPTSCRRMKLATFNLYQFAEPGHYWYERDHDNSYQSREWKKKKRWIEQQLIDMDADVIGFQEVFSVERLKGLCKHFDYPYFATVDAPRTDENDGDVFVSPVVAIASRWPIRAVESPGVANAVREPLPVADDFRFSREPVCATIQTPELGDVTIYVVHLKSRRPIMAEVTYPEDVEWSARVRDTLLRRSRGDILSALQRGLESTLLYHDIITKLTEQPNRQIAVLGDMNSDEHSVSVQALTQREKIFEVGGIDAKDWDESAKRAIHDNRLMDVYSIAPNIRSKQRPYTHLHRGNPKVLDYILVSNSLNQRNNEARGEVVHYEVLNKHLRGDNTDNKLQSDHGLVVVELQAANAAKKGADDLPINQRRRVKGDGWVNKRDRASDEQRQRFIEASGGVYRSRKGYRQLKSKHKWSHFWSFFFDTDHGWVKSVYGAIPVDTLVQKRRHTIEHIVPRSFLREYLIRKNVPRNVRNGAETNPFNLIPADRRLNSRRSSFQFDFEDDRIIRPPRIHLNPDAYASTGIDADNEWVIPTRTRGDIARGILYMLLIYEIDELYSEHIKTLVHWAKVDMPSRWELAYNEWVQERHGIRNPLIDKPEISRAWLDDMSLLNTLVYEKGRR